MGSFDETCGVSGLPVGYRTPCRMFIITPHWYLELDYQAKWEPEQIVPFVGEYDDYGQLKNLADTPLSRLQHRSLLARVLDFTEEDREDHWEEFKRWPDDPWAMVTLCERGVLKIKNAHGKHTAAPFYVREDVYQKLIEFAADGEDWLGRPMRETVAAMIEARFERPDAWETAFQNESEQERRAAHKRIIELEQRDNGHGTHLGSMLLLDHRDAVRGDPALREALMEAMREFEMFCMGLEMVRAHWAPKLYRGQDPAYRFHAKWHRALASICDQAQKGMKE